MAQSDGQARHAAGEAMKPPTLAERVAFVLPCRCGIRPYHTEFCPASHRHAVLALCSSIARESREAAGGELVDIVFDGPPGPTAGRFVEVENMRGQSLSVGEWVQRPDGYWVLRLRALLTPPDEQREETP